MRSFAFCNRYDTFCLSCLSVRRCSSSSSFPSLIRVFLVFLRLLFVAILISLHACQCVCMYLRNSSLPSPPAHHRRRYSSCGMFDTTIKKEKAHTHARTRKTRKLNYTNTIISFLGLVLKIGREKKNELTREFIDEAG
jgi:hypothetical protein